MKFNQPSEHIVPLLFSHVVTIPNLENNNYVTLTNGQRVHKSIVRQVKTNLMQAGTQDIQYELDDQKVLDLMLKFGCYAE